MTLRSSTLRPLSVDKPEFTNTSILPDKLAGMQIGQLVFFEDDSSDRGLLASTIPDVSTDKVQVQINQPKPGVDTWLPRWHKPSQPHLILRHKDRPAGTEPFLEKVSSD